MKIKSKKAYAVVNKKKPIISVLDIYDHNDLHLGRDEKIIRVIISSVEKSL